MQTNPSVKTRDGAWWQCALLLLAVIGAIFWRSLIPSQVMFANDGPLGPLCSQNQWYWETFTGAWLDLNWVGGQTPGALPNLTTLVFFCFGPIGLLKINAGFSLVVLGMGAWFFFRRLGLSFAVCVVGGLAAALNSNAFSNACWGLPAWAYTRGLAFFAMGLLVSRSGPAWMRFTVAGCALGLGVADGFDTGAIFSLFVAAFAVYEALLGPTPLVQRLTAGVLRVTVVAVAAGIVAAQVLSTLVGTQIVGAQGTQQDSETKEQRWDFATQWSLPKVETIRVMIPGLFGYRYDTPEGGNYWGTVGQTPGWEVHHQGTPRYSGSGEYAGLLVVMMAALALFHALRTKDSPFSAREKKLIWFWAAMALISLLLAFGRHAPFYRLIYYLPFFSTIRNPIKFMQPFQMALVILCAYGLEAVARLYLSKSAAQFGSLRDRLNAWWKQASIPDKRSFILLGAWLIASLIGLLAYYSARKDILGFLTATGMPENFAPTIFSFSMGEFGWYLLFLVLNSLVLVLIASGALAGKRARLSWFLLGGLLVADLVRANAPWIVYYDYTYKYASSPVIETLQKITPEGRVAILPLQVNNALSKMQEIYGGDWMQHLFQYYRVVSLDRVQERSVAQDNAAFRKALGGGMPGMMRMWELTSTRYLIGLSGGLAEVMNKQFDAGKDRFRVHTAYDLAPKPTCKRNPQTEELAQEDWTTVVRTNGLFAIIEFTGALPRASLYAKWQAETNDDAALKTLADPQFDPHRTVLVCGPEAKSSPLVGIVTNAGTVELKNYAPKHQVYSVKAEAPSVLLINDKYDPNWKVWVDGQPQPLLRCNYLMRGVQVPAGTHTIGFRFMPSTTYLWVSLAAIGVCLLLGVVLIIKDRQPAAESK